MDPDETIPPAEGPPTIPAPAPEAAEFDVDAYLASIPKNHLCLPITEDPEAWQAAMDRLDKAARGRPSHDDE